MFDAKNQQDVTVVYDRTTPCLQETGGRRSLYRVFALPATPQPYLITIAGQSWSGTMFAPRAEFLSADGAVKRTIDRASFEFRGDSLAAIVRNHPDEMFLVVASDPDLAGQSFQRIAGATAATYMSTGRAGFMLHTGSETNSPETFSHAGRAVISVTAMPTN